MQRFLCAACRDTGRVYAGGCDIPGCEHYRPCGHVAEAHRGHRAYVRDEAREGDVDVAATDVICPVCNDTHVMQFGECDPRMCTRCPTPCRSCAQDGGRGAYCAKTPCACACHLRPYSPYMSRPAPEPKLPMERDRIRDLQEANAAISAHADGLRDRLREMRAERDEAVQERDRWIARVQSQERIVRRVREVVG